MQQPGSFSAAFLASITLGTVIGITAIAVTFTPAVKAFGQTNAMGDAKTASGAPVLVELFTSEGCSSCPPADALLARIQKSYPSAIVLSEHVTYWNDIGWKDPFSSRESTDRQGDYVARLNLQSSYTPQMVVDGQYEFVGSDEGHATQAIQKSAAKASVAVTITNVETSGNHLNFSLETGPVAKRAQLIAVIAQNEGLEHVANGENGGRTLRHVQIARTMKQIADVKGQASYSGTVSLDLPQPVAGSGWHVVVFLQQGTGGPIVGAASHPV